ncbi:MAG TPA: LysR family transcriptional regulator [Actinomycetales bacterium]|nr:LysR family transcriptional regulator [Actinomycetales bacterium]
MELDPSALRLMRLIADTGTISAAAERIGTSQPAVSQQVRRLERRLGTALLERAGRGIRLTEAGEVLARHGSAVTAALEAAREEVEALAGLQTGRVRLTAFPSSSATLVPRALALLRDRHPGVRITLTEAEPPESIDQLRDGQCDIAIAFSYSDNGIESTQGASDTRGLVTQHLLDDDMWLALPTGHPAGSTDVVDLAELDGETWIAGCPRCRGHLLDVCERAGFEPEISYATDDYVAVLGLVAAGLGVALIPGLVLDATRNDAVQLHRVRPASRRGVFAVTTEDLLRVPAVAAALEALCETASGLPRC